MTKLELLSYTDFLSVIKGRPPDLITHLATLRNERIRSHFKHPSFWIDLIAQAYQVILPIACKGDYAYFYTLHLIQPDNQALQSIFTSFREIEIQAWQSSQPLLIWQASNSILPLYPEMRNVYLRACTRQGLVLKIYGYYLDHGFLDKISDLYTEEEGLLDRVGFLFEDTGYPVLY